MRYLLDTHVLLWWHGNDHSLPAPVRTALMAPESELFLSAVSVWEISIKLGLGKLRLAMPLADLLETETRINGLQMLAITAWHALRISDFPAIHADPFDRMLIAQAIHEDLTLVSADAQIARYPGVRILWPGRVDATG